MPTIQSVLDLAIRQLRAGGTGDTPALDAQLWLAHVCRLDRTQVLTHPERELSPEETARFKEGVTRMVSGEPLPYLTGRAEFYGLTFAVTPATLIPRPETEHLVEAALDLCDQRRDWRVADVGTGSGCIAVTLSVHRPNANLFAVDLSPAALEVAARNAKRHGVAERITFLQGHLLDPLPGPVDLILANLPYVADDEWDELPVSVREYEPAGALRGGKHGLDLIDELLAGAPVSLRTQGAIILEIGAAQGPAALALAEACLPDAQIRLEQDYADRDRLLIIQNK